KRLQLTADTLALGTELIKLFRGAQGQTRGTLEAELQVLEGDQTDYRVKRGLAHLLASAFSTFDMHSPVNPADRPRPVSALSAPPVPSPQQSLAPLTGWQTHSAVSWRA